MPTKTVKTKFKYHITGLLVKFDDSTEPVDIYRVATSEKEAKSFACIRSKKKIGSLRDAHVECLGEFTKQSKEVPGQTNLEGEITMESNSLRQKFHTTIGGKDVVVIVTLNMRKVDPAKRHNEVIGSVIIDGRPETETTFHWIFPAYEKPVLYRNGQIVPKEFRDSEQDTIMRILKEAKQYRKNSERSK